MRGLDCMPTFTCFSFLKANRRPLGSGTLLLCIVVEEIDPINEVIQIVKKLKRRSGSSRCLDAFDSEAF